MISAIYWLVGDARYTNLNKKNIIVNLTTIFMCDTSKKTAAAEP